MNYKYLDSKDCLMVVVGSHPYAISAGHPLYLEIRAAVIRGQPESEVLAIINRKSNAAQTAVRQLANEGQLGNRLSYSHGVIYLDGRALHNYAAKKLAEFVENGYPCAPMAAFVVKQEMNPDPVMIEHLYQFMEFGKIPITPDGDFLVYKAVREDYRDIHSGQFLNSIGSKPSVPRSAVDPERSRTCSNGLHVCSYAYLPHFAHANGHVMLCKVNPANVVAIPNDYNNTKMRVCEYEVVEEVTSYYKSNVDVLGTGPALRTEKYEVRYLENPNDEDHDVYDTYYTEEEARAQAEALREQGYEAEVHVRE